MTHVEQLESGGYVCKSCGGRVAPDGYSEGGEVEEVSGELPIGDELDEESPGVSPQSIGADRLVAAMKRRKA